jgi:hypothetical protein
MCQWHRQSRQRGGSHHDSRATEDTIGGVDRSSGCGAKENGVNRKERRQDVGAECWVGRAQRRSQRFRGAVVIVAVTESAREQRAWRRRTTWHRTALSQRK